ncbi:uncharacterized protein [Physcomitrium patens]|uniref:uncharacterized protein n=1 Tax=Physcomitrium patens TaxID=3218 RepID=UPI003CCD9E92
MVENKERLGIEMEAYFLLGREENDKRRGETTFETRKGLFRRLVEFFFFVFYFCCVELQRGSQFYCRRACSASLLRQDDFTTSGVSNCIWIACALVAMSPRIAVVLMRAKCFSMQDRPSHPFSGCFVSLGAAEGVDELVSGGGKSLLWRGDSVLQWCPHSEF